MSISVCQQAPAGEAEARHQPGQEHPEHQVDGDRQQRDKQRQADRRQGVVVAEIGPEHRHALGEGLGEDRDQRQQQKQRRQAQRETYQQPADTRRVTDTLHQPSPPCSLRMKRPCHRFSTSSSASDTASTTEAIAEAPT